MITKNIHIEYRAPRTLEEKESYGQTFSNNEKADIFINLHKNRTSDDTIDTFFHELAHVFFAFYKTRIKVSAADEEKMAKQIGRVCAGVLR
jgi:hypothetical protein